MIKQKEIQPIAPPPPLAITMGKARGIGPEIILKAWGERKKEKLPPFFILGEFHTFETLSQHLKLKVPLKKITRPEDAISCFHTHLPILPITAPTEAEIALKAIDKAVAFCLDQQASSMVTAPINKADLYEIGFKHQGHTDYIASLVNRKTSKNIKPVMLLSAKGLYIIPLTIHIPLKDVPKTLSIDGIISTTKIIFDSLPVFLNNNNFHLAITGLNPHAGENGTMGREEIDIIIPAIQQLKSMNYNVSGPYPADTLFHEEKRKTYDAVLAMYHDQALIPVKMLGFDEGVNTTLGLPFIRTSPDHGTAEDIYRKGIANPASMIAAIRQAYTKCVN